MVGYTISKEKLCSKCAYGVNICFEKGLWKELGEADHSWYCGNFKERGGEASR